MQLFRPYTSLFRDPGIDEATTKMVERYYKNMEYSDALGQKLNELQNAPFEGDATLNKELKTKINSSLESLASEGRYEHAEKDLRSLGMTFNTMAPAIAQNNALYSKANEELKTRLEKKEINDEQYQLARIYNTYGYEGLKLGDDGRVDQNSYFSAKTIYNDPRPIDMLTGRFKDLLKRTQNIENATVGQNADGKWTYTTAEGTMQFKDSDVDEVVKSVKEDPNVMGYISQLSDMRATASQASNSGTNILNSQLASYKENLVLLQKGKEQAKGDEVSLYDAKIEEVGKSMAELEKVITSGDPTMISQAVKQMSMDEEFGRLDDYGNTQRGLQTYTKSTKRDQDYAKSNARYEAYLNLGMMTTTSGEITAATDGSGDTYAKKKEFLTNAYTESYKYGELLKDTTLSADLRATYEGLKRAADIKIQKTESAMKEAADRSISMIDLEKQDPKIIAMLKTLMPEKSTAGDIYRKLQDVFDNSSDQDYMDFKAAFDKENGAGAFDNHIAQKYGSGQNQGSVPLTDWRGAEIAASRDQRVSFSENIPAANQLISTTFKNAFDDKVTAKFKEIKTSSEFTNQITMPTQEETVRATNGINAFFGIMGGKTGRPLRDTEQVIVNGETKYGKDAEVAGYNVVKWQYSPDADMFEIQLRGTGDNAESTKTVYMSGSQVSQPLGKDTVLNTPVQKFATEINQNSYGLDTGKSKRINGVWSFNGQTLDYEVKNVNGVNTISFYTEGSNTPVAISDSGKTSYTMSDSEIQALFNTGKVKPIPRKYNGPTTTYFQF
jgi:hypothetical protein